MKTSNLIISVFFFAFSSLTFASPSLDTSIKGDRCPSLPHPVGAQVGDKCYVPKPHATPKHCTIEAIRQCSKKGHSYCGNRC